LFEIEDKDLDDIIDNINTMGEGQIDEFTIDRKALKSQLKKLRKTPEKLRNKDKKIKIAIIEEVLKKTKLAETNKIFCS
jgi:predicted RNase H-like nuclease (RuvC/YqgF family)